MNPRLRFKRDDGTDYPDWEEKKLGDICNINPQTEKLDDKFIYIDLGCIEQGEMLTKNIITKTKAPSRAKRVLSKNDVLFQSVRPHNLGHFHYKNIFDIQAVASTGFFQLRMINGLNSFLYQVLYTENFNKEVDVRCVGSNYPAINSSSFSEIVISLPCLEEQKKIGSFLSDIDEVILASDQEVKKLQELKKGAMQKIFSQEVRFKRDDGTDYPDWEEKKLGDITSFIRNGFSYKEGNNKNFPVSRIETISDRIVNYNRIGYAEFVPEDYLLKTGDILFSNINSLEHIGKTAFYESNSKLYHGMNLICLRPSDINNKFLFYLLNTETVKKINYIHAKRAVSQCSISVSDIRSYKLHIPCLEEQQKIGDFLSDFDEAISLAKQELEKWKLLKKGLLQQ